VRAVSESPSVNNASSDSDSLAKIPHHERVDWLKKRYLTLQKSLEKHIVAKDQFIQFGQLLRSRCSDEERSRFLHESKEYKPQILALLKDKIIQKTDQSVCLSIYENWHIWVWDFPSTLPTPKVLGERLLLSLKKLSRLVDYAKACDLLQNSLRRRLSTFSLTPWLMPKDVNSVMPPMVNILPRIFKVGESDFDSRSLM